jgi:ribosomal protein S18 acetylase RimI-like enzyme
VKVRSLEHRAQVSYYSGWRAGRWIFIAQNASGMTKKEKRIMNHFRIEEAQAVPESLRQLYEVYKASLPRCKQALVGQIMPAQLLEFPGLVCFDGDSPIASVLWKETVPRIVVAEFYAESPRAPIKAVEILFGKFLSRTSRARARYFELWKSPRAHVQDVLVEKGFQPLARQLLAFRKPVTSSVRWNEFRFVSLRNFGDPTGAHTLANFLHEAYRGTLDGEFYEEYKDLRHCQNYVARVLSSPFCDFQNSWLAWSPQANKMAGLALCYIWPGARGLYLEQLAVHPSFRRKGLGQVLLSRVSSALRDGTLTRILATISRENAPATRLYHSAGAEVLDNEVAFVKKDSSARSDANPERTTVSGDEFETCGSDHPALLPQ